MVTFLQVVNVNLITKRLLRLLPLRLLLSSCLALQKRSEADCSQLLSGLSTQEFYLKLRPTLTVLKINQFTFLHCSGRTTERG